MPLLAVLANGRRRVLAARGRRLHGNTPEILYTDDFGGVQRVHPRDGGHVTVVPSGGAAKRLKVKITEEPFNAMDLREAAAHRNGSCCKNPSRCRHNNPILSGMVAGVAAGVAGAVANKYLTNGLLSGIASDGTRYVVKKDRDWNEWQVVAYVGGKRHEGKTYYAGGGDKRHKEDAIATFRSLVGQGRSVTANSSKVVRTYSVPSGYERRIVATLSNLFVWAKALDGKVMTLAKPDLTEKVIAHVCGKNGGRKNPLSAKESAREIRGIRRLMSEYADRLRTGRGEGLSAYDEARAIAGVVGRHGTRRARLLAARAMRHLRYSNNSPAAQNVITVPFRQGRKYSVAQVAKWVEAHGTPAMKDRFNKAMAQYQRFHKGSMPKFITYSLYKMGSHPGISDVEFGVSEGHEWMAAYQVPRSSGKWMDKASAGRYVHAHGDSEIEVDVKRPVRLGKLPVRFHTPDGKAVGVIPSRNVKIGEWYEG
jgi:hypothetical protein